MSQVKGNIKPKGKEIPSEEREGKGREGQMQGTAVIEMVDHIALIIHGHQFPSAVVDIRALIGVIFVYFH
jgi:hypothetical protein